MQRRMEDQREPIVAAVRRHVATMNTKDLGVDAEQFVVHYYRNAAPEDLVERDPGDLAGAALDHLRFALERRRGRAKVRVFNPDTEAHPWHSTHTVVQLVNDDMPFLVDSVAMLLNEAGFTIHVTVHPVVKAHREASGRLTAVLARDSEAHGARDESLIHFEIDRETEPQILADLEKHIRAALRDVRSAVRDWRAMKTKALDICARLKETPPPLDDANVAESIEFLEWMAEDHFTFLGYRQYRLIRSDNKRLLQAITGSGLGILRRGSRKRPEEFKPGTADEYRKQSRSGELLVLTKASSRSTVHRPTYLDYVGVKTFDEKGRLTGEHRFLGLYTSTAYSRSPRSIPLLRYKVARVLQESALQPGGHAGKALQHVLETYPRDELFQISTRDLGRIASGILNLQERQRVKLFVRRDDFHRFLSCLVFVPRDRYNTQVRERVEALLMEAFRGRSTEHTVQLADSKLARVHIILWLGDKSPARIDIARLEQRLAAAVRSWEDHLREALIEHSGEEQGIKLAHRYAACFPAAYTEDFGAAQAVADVATLDELEQSSAEFILRLGQPEEGDDRRLRLKLFRRGEPIALSDGLPILENMDLKVIAERPYRMRMPDEPIWIQEFEMQYLENAPLDPDALGARFSDAFARIWAGDAEDDGFNRLILLAGLDWREVAMLRAYCRFLLQTGTPFSQSYMEEVLIRNVSITRLLADKIAAYFDPDLGDAKREQRIADIARRLDEAMDQVHGLDEDRILGMYRNVIRSTLRTNFYQADGDGQPKPYISFKLDSRSLAELPLPRPAFEIFVYSPRMEGVHLRGGKVARGGLRWSDRREDFRTEILGLMKAQTVKNTLIVPVGAKGGFVCKKLPSGDREAVQAEVVACYRTLIRGLLDLTDNLEGTRVIPPGRVVRRDSDDYYLVVAADKGTATFSDIANAISADYGFWLGDAFASGGSAGYDHKKMGITARGAWEAVKRHSRELGVDVQAQRFTVAGIGDMSGDVFGNGMLQSRYTVLRAAFNHQHVFLDPNPDPKRSYEERQRLFDLPRSSWTDYDPALISPGGGIYSRSEKRIPLSPEVRVMLEVDSESMTPQELIRAILRMPVDLLWNGGIGTYVKSARESNADVGDRANDPVRVDGRELRCRVVGEGGNLGITQLGRIEYALNDGRINTDFIDNSGGVDTSDREVNIKILFDLVGRQKRLTMGRRDKLLAAMTEEVAALVLRNNYLQTQAISMLEAHGVERLNENAFVLHKLEREGYLDRDLEHLPDEDTIIERRTQRKGFTRPELAVLVSYSKIALYQALIRSRVPEDPYLARELELYFPHPLQRRYKALLPAHPLSREIIATLISNSMVNRMGPVFVLRMQEDTGADIARIAKCYAIVREVLGVRELWAQIEALDNEVHANVQYSMMFQTTRLLRFATHWLLGRDDGAPDIEAWVSRLKPGVARLQAILPDLLKGGLKRRYGETVQLYLDIGVPAELSARVAAIPAAFSALDIVEEAQRAHRNVELTGRVYFDLGAGLHLDWIRDQIESLHVDGRWQAMARGSLRENLFSLQRRLTDEVLTGAAGANPADLVVVWLDKAAEKVSHTKHVLQEMRLAGSLDFPTLSVALQEIRKLAKTA